MWFDNVPTFKECAANFLTMLTKNRATTYIYYHQLKP